MSAQLIEVTIKDEFITLSQLLKKESIVSSGGEVKIFLATNQIKINGVPNSQRGKKLYRNDIVEINGIDTYIIK